MARPDYDGQRVRMYAVSKAAEMRISLGKIPEIAEVLEDADKIVKFVEDK